MSNSYAHSSISPLRFVSSASRVLITCMSGGVILYVSTSAFDLISPFIPIPIAFSLMLTMICFLTFHVTHMVYAHRKYLDTKVWKRFNPLSQLSSFSTLGLVILLSLICEVAWQLDVEALSGQMGSPYDYSALSIAGRLCVVLFLLVVLPEVGYLQVGKTLSENYESYSDLFRDTCPDKMYFGYSLLGALVLWVPFAGDSIWSVHPLALIIAVNLICVDMTRYFINGLILPSQI